MNSENISEITGNIGNAIAESEILNINNEEDTEDKESSSYYLLLGDILSDIANAIREKRFWSNDKKMYPHDMAEYIRGIKVQLDFEYEEKITGVYTIGNTNRTEKIIYINNFLDELDGNPETPIYETLCENIPLTYSISENIHYNNVQYASFIDAWSKNDIVYSYSLFSLGNDIYYNELFMIKDMQTGFTLNQDYEMQSQTCHIDEGYLSEIDFKDFDIIDSIEYMEE